jgi:hypothetical protein
VEARGGEGTRGGKVAGHGFAAGAVLSWNKARYYCMFRQRLSRGKVGSLVKWGILLELDVYLIVEEEDASGRANLKGRNHST